MAKDKDRKRIEDEAGVGPDPRTSRHLVPLKELPRFRIVGSDPDIRGWSVFTSNGREVGHVDDLLVDPTIDEAVMLDIDLTGSDRHTLAPIRAAWIDREHERVILDGAELTAGSDLPSLGRTPPTDEELARFGDRYSRTWGDRAVERDHDYRIRHAGEELHLTPRAGDADAARTPGPEVVVERRVVSPDEPSWAEASRTENIPHDVRYPDETRAAPGDRHLVEEVVVRRRYVDAAELDEERRAAERRVRESGDVPPPSSDEDAETRP